MKQRLINAVVCGSTSTSSLFWNVLYSLDSLFNICGYWDPTAGGNSSDFPLKKLGGSFSDLLNCSQYDVVFLCFSPQIQFKLLQTFLNEPNKKPTESTVQNLPLIVLLPPVSPSYSISALIDSNRFIAVAMPLRKLTATSLLNRHLEYLDDRSPHSILKLTPSLPLHWTLGELRSLHVRLAVSNSVRADQYSWLCEPGIIGGGIINLYGAGLIDLAFHLTGGLHILSLNCICRTFDREVCSEPGSIRRINAEDYVLVTAECESRSPNPCKPVVMLCISADLPQASGNDLSISGFSLSIELTGSTGRFVLPMSGDKVCWSKVNTVLSKATTLSNGSNLCNGRKDFPTHEPMLNGLSNDKVNAGEFPTVQNSQTKLLKVGPAYTIELLDQGAEQTAVICPESPVHGDSTKSCTKPSEPSLLREAWTQWLSQLYTSLHSPDRKQSMEYLVALPEHWDYIQRVIKSMDQSARTRSWIEIATGQPM